MKVHPSDRSFDKRYTKALKEAGRIVSRKNTKRSEIASLLKKLKKKNLSGLEKEEVRVKLKRRLSEALVEGEFSRRATRTTSMVFANLIMEGIEMVHAKPGDSIIMYLKCKSVKSLLSLRDMVLSGFLLELLSDAIEDFIQVRLQIQLIITSDDYNLCLSYLSSVAGKFIRLLLLVLNVLSKVVYIF